MQPNENGNDGWPWQFGLLILAALFFVAYDLLIGYIIILTAHPFWTIVVTAAVLWALSRRDGTVSDD